MARFLEKGCIAGRPKRSANWGPDMRRRIRWWSRRRHCVAAAAANQGDAHAQRLLGSLVLPLAGDESAARAAIEEVRQGDPWLAVRLTLARDFGLTKLEALSVDPVEGRRPWGLLVGRNPFITQARLSAPRAVTALTPRRFTWGARRLF